MLPLSYFVDESTQPNAFFAPPPALSFHHCRHYWETEPPKYKICRSYLCAQKDGYTGPSVHCYDLERLDRMAYDAAGVVRVFA